MSNLSCLGVENPRLVTLARAAALDSVEKGRHSIIVILCPALEGVVVALGAGNARTQKYLRRCLNRIVAISRSPKKISRWIEQRAAAGS